MDTGLIQRLNRLWEPVYPFLAQWLSPWLPKPGSRLLELGPFSGGIAAALKAVRPELRTACLLQEKSVARMLQTSLGATVAIGNLERLPFSRTFEMVLFRGAFFFLSPPMLQEIERVLLPGGHALVGGGFGPLTPAGIIAPIAGESRDLNYRLGKTWISKDELAALVTDARLTAHTQPFEDGGLWLLMRKPPA